MSIEGSRDLDSSAGRLEDGQGLFLNKEWNVGRRVIVGKSEFFEILIFDFFFGYGQDGLLRGRHFFSVLFWTRF